MTDIEKQINLVVVARDKAKLAAEKKTAAFIEWRDAHLDLLENEDFTKKVCAEAEGALRLSALDIYAETKDKQVAPGIVIKEFTKYAYNEAEALKWAIEHNMALKLDETKFKSHVKADPPDFVVVTTEPQATIATELQVIE